MTAILRFIIGLVVFFIGIVVMKIVLALVAGLLKIVLIVLFLGALALIGYFVFRIMFPNRAEPV
ncbi:MAG: hypothetical protein ACJ74J_10495 [Blastocatellia bacterium]